ASADGMEEGARAMVAMQRRIVAMGKPVVTRMHGAVRAGGIGIVAASDIAISAADTTYALTEVRLGLAPAVISLTVLPRLTSRAAALTCLTGEVFDGTQAAEMGLVTRAVPEDELDDAVSAVVASLRSGAPQGLRETKALLARDLLARIDARGGEMAELSARLFGSDAAREAMLAFLAKK
ncbi:MAG TPA: enoyl-CoA hydratase-related protein, partial [Nocardioides sp.]|nr:enoyl-CoA hydratase-related protein [Nocardioides sp.]